MDEEKEFTIGECLDRAAKSVVDNYCKSQAVMAIGVWLELVEKLAIEYNRRV